MVSPGEALEMLEKTSRTFSIPIGRLPAGLQEAVASAYLCMRALDEIEDHPHLNARTKVRLLRAASQVLQAQTEEAHFAEDAFAKIFNARHALPEVSLRLAEWACYAPEAIAPRIWDATAAMAERMASWIARGWKIQNEADLDGYTFAVAGTVGVLLCDIWAWFDGIQMHRSHAIQFGRGLQAVNMLRNRSEDLARGVDFFPTGWTEEHMTQYALHNLSHAERYATVLPPGPFASFIQLPLALAYATLDALAAGETKLSRSTVLQLVQHIG
ncbi:MAG: phytoene/squalene synthase family protein [Chloroflexota bacterium]|nr:phytoene/squalene synthase family protein [Chloroflexota bacterium]